MAEPTFDFFGALQLKLLLCMKLAFCIKLVLFNIANYQTGAFHHS